MKAFNLYTLIFLLMIWGCAHKEAPPISTEKGPETSEPQSPEAEIPEDEAVEGADSETGDEEPVAPPKRKPRIALVFGGVGIASWATVGALKKFEEAETKIACIVAAGWPSIFALGYGFHRTIHDLEWFARRLEEKNFYKSSFLDFRKQHHDHAALTTTLKKSFDEKRALGQTRVPVFLAVSFPAEAQPTIYRTGNWLGPILKTMTTPGIYHPLQPDTPRKKATWGILSGLPVDEARTCGADFVVVFDMYEDYLDWLAASSSQKKDDESAWRKSYASHLRSGIQKENSSADFNARIELKKSPLDFSPKLGAIKMGYEKAAEIVRRLDQMEVR